MPKLMYGQARARVLEFPAAAPAEQRDHPRVTPLEQMAKLVGPCGEYPCIVRDLSATGVSVQLYHALPDTRGLSLQLPNGNRYLLLIVWQDGSSAGFRFMTPPDLADLLDAPQDFARRAVRINLEVPCRIEGPGIAREALLCNLSQGGALLRAAMPAAPGQLLRIDLPGLSTRDARTRWRRASYYGVELAGALTLQDFAAIAYDLQAGLRANP